MKTIEELTDDQLSTLRHMLGINTPSDKEPRPYRNYAAVSPGDKAFEELERLGAVERRPTPQAWSGLETFRCTEAGKLTAMRSHKKIRYSRSRRKYLAFLDCCECFPDLTFKQFLTDPQFKEERANA
jgi:hypothetical protein